MNYLCNLACKWLVTAPLNTYIRISFYNFSTEPFYDRIELYNGKSCGPITTQLATFSGSRDGLLFTQCDSLYNSLVVEFKTDSIISDSGFRADISVTKIREKQSKSLTRERECVCVWIGHCEANACCFNPQL